MDSESSESLAYKINRMVNEATSNSEEDRKAKEKAEAHNEADQLAYSMEKALSEYGDKVTDADRESIGQKISALRTTVESGSADEIRARMEELSTAGQQLSEEIYKTQGAADAASEGEDPNLENEKDTTEVEYEVVD